LLQYVAVAAGAALGANLRYLVGLWAADRLGFTWETLALAESGAWLRAGLYVVGSNVVGLVSVWLGWLLGRMI